MRSDLASADVFPHEVDKWKVTEETLVDVYLSSDASISAGAWGLIPYDAENKDELGEFDTGANKFTPRVTGWYLIACSVMFDVTADQDRLQTRLYNTTADTSVYQASDVASGTYSKTVAFSGVKKLIGGDDYKVHAQNVDSDDTLISGERQSYLQIRSVFRQS